MAYSDSLPENISLQVFSSDVLIFQSGGKWLYPLDDLYTFLDSYKGDRSDLSAHDTAIGKAAAVLMVRAGIRKINAEVLSDIAKDYIDSLNENHSVEQKVYLMWTKKVPALKCATEVLLKDLKDDDEMYDFIHHRICDSR